MISVRLFWPITIIVSAGIIKDRTAELKLIREHIIVIKKKSFLATTPNLMQTT